MQYEMEVVRCVILKGVKFARLNNDDVSSVQGGCSLIYSDCTTSSDDKVDLV